MGYYANGYGHITAKDVESYKKIRKMFGTEGEVEYAGEDDYHWKYVFDFESSCWHEKNGRIIYDLSELSDDELCTELQKRGYNVQNIPLSDYVM